MPIAGPFDDREVVVVGGSIGGMATALALSRMGHQVTVIERDPLPDVANPDVAFATERRGTPQSHQTHGFLARLTVIMRDRYPDLVEALTASGIETVSLTESMTDRQPGDDDLSVLVVRRTTFEMVFRRAVLAQPGISLRSGVGVTGLMAMEAKGGTPHVVGVTLSDGTNVPGTVIACTGRRSDVPGWLAPLGVLVPEEATDTDMIYMTRWYHRPEPAPVVINPRLGGDFGYLKYLAFPCDGNTFSVTMAIGAQDAELRRALAEPLQFDRACQLLPGPATYFGTSAGMTGIGEVRPMGGFINRIRRFTDADGQPNVLGFHAVGDAHTCTNPFYGRGCSLALVQATLLADAFAAHPNDPLARASLYEATSTREVEPWYHASVFSDSQRRRGTRNSEAGTFVRQFGELVLDVMFGLSPDPVVTRGLIRLVHLLVRPDELFANIDFVTRVTALLDARQFEGRSPLTSQVPRDTLLRALAA